MSGCFDNCIQEGIPNLNKLQKLSLEDKILYSQVKIRQFYVARKGAVYVSYSGGKDSTVLLDLVRSVCPDVPAVFVDTGLEFPEIRDFARNTPNTEIIRPKMNFKQVVQKYGYPVIGKDCASAIYKARKGQPFALKQMENDGRFGFKRYAYMMDAPFPIHSYCCNILKKNPAKLYLKETGRAPYVGTKATDSQQREAQAMTLGDIRVEGKSPQCTPMMIWNDDDIWNYIHLKNLPYCKIYDMGYDRTGCVFCMFGIMHDKDRFLKLKATHPKLWTYCMKPLDEGGLGMKEVLEYMGIPTGCEQMNLLDFVEMRQ